jgi:hypothetical protein
MSSRIARSAATISLVVASVISGCSLLPCIEQRHASGLLVVCPESFRDMPEELKGAASFAWELAEENPDAFGLPWPDPDSGAIEVRIASPNGEALAREWMAGNAVRKGPKPTAIRPPEVPVTFTTVDRSFRRLTDIQHGSVPAKGLPDGDAIFSTGTDARRNVAVITVDRLSDPLLRALAARYGTAALVIRVEPNPHAGY